MGEKAYTTPNVLRWARESARMSEETAATKVSVSVDKIREWESGNSQPTIRQAQTLAKAYKRPFALLFLSEIPKDFQPLQDFRKKGSKELTTASIFIIREIQQKQAWISSVYAEEKKEKIEFCGRYSIKDPPTAVADDILKTLSIVPAKYKSGNPIKEWIDAAETNGIFVSRTSFIHSRLSLDSEELQGFAIADPYAPFVFVNSDDWNAPQLFTLVHELAHIWIAESGISNEIEPGIKNRDKYHPVETFCNEVAANALMPIEIVMSLDSTMYEGDYALFLKSAKSMGVSTFALLVRALNLNQIPVQKYQKLKKKVEIQFQEFLEREEALRQKQKEKSGGPSPYLLRLNKNSRLFTQVVFDALRNGDVQPTQASLLLGTPAANFHKLEALMYR